MKYLTALLLLLVMAQPAVVAQQEIELQLETPVAVESAPESVPVPVEMQKRIKAITVGKAPAIDGASAILIDAETGQMLYEKNAFVKRPMASTTKIMTAIVALERCNLNETVVVGPNPPKVPYTSLNLRKGERLPLRDVMVGMLVRSANDAAVAVAEHVAGSVPEFAKLMNKKAKEIGAKNTNFVNPNGLYDPKHYSTAYDLALITRYALQNPEFNKIVNTRKWTLTRSINTKDLVVFNRSPFMKNYKGADGVKSGYIKQAGYCYVGSATRKDWRLISVVLKSNNSSKDSMALMDYGFSNFRRVEVAPKGKSYQSERLPGVGKITGAAEETLYALVPVGDEDLNLEAEAHFADVGLPLRRGQVVGSLVASIDGTPVGAVPLKATRDYENSMVAYLFWPWMKKGMILLICTGMVFRYGGAVAKNPRRFWRRI